MFKKNPETVEDDPVHSARKRLPQSFMEAAADFERTRIEEVQHSRRLAWWVAGMATCICSVAVVGSVLALIWRTEPEPTILRVDNSTGATTMLRSIKDTQDRYDEVVDKYWLGRFIHYCEEYDWFTVAVDIESCKLMSVPAVASEFDSKLRAADSPLNELSDKGRVRVQISAIAFIGTNAQIRFTKQRLSPNGESLDHTPPQKWIATAAFNFHAGHMTDQQRLVNPLGFRVLAYRVDPEVVQ